MGCCEQKPTEGGSADPKLQVENILASLPTVVHGFYDTGGHQLQGLAMTLPPHDDVERKYGRPSFHKDGSIEYPAGPAEPPKDINGYYRDENNPFLFHPLWGECVLRFQGSRLDRATGEIDLKMVCNNPQVHLTFQKFVTAQQCSDCPARKHKERKNPA